MPRSSANDTVLRASHADLTTAMSSDSAELCAMAHCVLLYDLKTELPQSTVPPEVLLRLALHPAQFVSEYKSTTSGAHCHEDSETALGLPARYLASLCSLLQESLVGALIVLHNSLTAYWISALSWAM